MKIIYICLFSVLLGSYLYANEAKGEKCVNDSQCGFGLQCSGGVCTKKSEYDYGSSGKTGKQCTIDSDCIGSGKCASGTFGKKYCTGN